MEHIYSIVSDTANSKVNSSKLSGEISNSSIVPTLDRIDTDSDSLNIFFTSVLSAGEIITLTGLVNSHDGVYTPSVNVQTVEFARKSPLTGRPEIIIVESEGSGDTMASHSFMDKTTWYCESVRSLGESPSLDSGKVYSLSNVNIIDCHHGKITFEDSMHIYYGFVAYDNGSELTIDVDYTVDYDLGKITIDANYTLVGSLTVDYSYATTSIYRIKPSSGKIMSVKSAEIQFTADLAMKPIVFEIWAYDPTDVVNTPPNKVPVFSRKYKSIKDIINVARQGKGSIPAIDVFTKPILVFPFSYDRKIALEYSKGMELVVRTDNDEVMGGEWGTITFYVTEEDESV